MKGLDLYRSRKPTDRDLCRAVLITKPAKTDEILLKAEDRSDWYTDIRRGRVWRAERIDVGPDRVDNKSL